MQKQNAIKVEGILKKTYFKHNYNSGLHVRRETQVFSLPSRKYATLQSAIRDCNIFCFGRELDKQLTEENVYKNMLVWSDSTSSHSGSLLTRSMPDLSTVRCNKCKYKYTVLRNSASKEEYCPACGEAGDVDYVAPFTVTDVFETSDVNATCNLKLYIKYTLDRFGKQFKIDGYLLSHIANHLFSDPKVKMNNVVSKVVSVIIMRLNPACIKEHKIKRVDLRAHESSSTKIVSASKKMSLRDSKKVNKKVKFLTNPPPLPPQYL